MGAPILNDLYPCFEGLMKLYQEEREHQYVFDHYKFYKFVNENTMSVLAQITNGVATALSSTGQMPSVIFLFLEDLIFTSTEIYLPSEIEAQLRWIFGSIDHMLKTRRRIMPKNSIRSLEPAVLLIKSLPRYDFGRMNMAYSEFTYRQERFNTMLQQIGNCYGFQVVETLSIHHKDYLCFDESGNGRQLSNRGKYRFWRELFQTMAENDKAKDRQNRKRILDEEMTRRGRSTYGSGANQHYY